METSARRLKALSKEGQIYSASMAEGVLNENNNKARYKISTACARKAKKMFSRISKDLPAKYGKLFKNSISKIGPF